MNPIVKKKWLNALRSGKFKQGQGALKNSEGHCCLGVLCEITGNSKNRDMQIGYPMDRAGFGEPVKSFCGLSVDMQSELATLNDDGINFSEIADVIEREVV
jgi:hypothetical protein